MEKIKTKKATEVIEAYEKEYKENCHIFKGAPDARYTNGYFIYATTWKGFAAPGTYGRLLAHSKTLKGLLSLLEIYKTGCVVGVLSDSDEILRN